MDFYLTALALGVVGLIVMAFSGLGRHARPAAGGHAAHGHAASHSGGRPHGVRESNANPLLSLMSPRLLFSVSLGLGTTGILLRPVLGGPLLFAAALAAGIAFERFLVTPIWNFAFRFASNPALTLESAVTDSATAVTTFDSNGQGLIVIELDGQSVQLLGTLQHSDRAMHVKVFAGARLRIEEVDSARNRCIVSLV